MFPLDQLEQMRRMLPGVAQRVRAAQAQQQPPGMPQPQQGPMPPPSPLAPDAAPPQAMPPQGGGWATPGQQVREMGNNAMNVAQLMPLKRFAQANTSPDAGLPTAKLLGSLLQPRVPEDQRNTDLMHQYVRSVARAPASLAGFPRDAMAAVQRIGGIPVPPDPVGSAQWYADRAPGMPKEAGSPYADFGAFMTGPQVLPAALRALSLADEAVQHGGALLSAHHAAFAGGVPTNKIPGLRPPPAADAVKDKLIAVTDASRINTGVGEPGHLGFQGHGAATGHDGGHAGVTAQSAMDDHSREAGHQMAGNRRPLSFSIEARAFKPSQRMEEQMRRMMGDM